MTPLRMLVPITLLTLLTLLHSGTSSAQQTAGVVPDPEALTHFEKRVRPLLVARCFSCHAEGVQQGGLRLDSREAILKGGMHGSALSLEKPAESLLSKAVHQMGDLKMPPSGKLSPEEVEAIDLWLRQGAIWPQVKSNPMPNRATALWSLLPVKRPVVPTVNHKSWGRGAMDAFILQRQEAAGVVPPSPADRRTLIRRATYDLTGLPPTPAEIDAFVQDRSPNAFEKVVDRLLRSPQYGEQWGRHWLDVVRYADTAGENSDHPLPHAWRYRNWVIDAFNANKPYDTFLKEQIAGDLMAAQGPPEQFASRTIATGYLAIARRFGHDIDQDMYLTYEDLIDTLGKSMLGLTVGCARCHDHKFDPISTRDYYGLYGIFSSTRFSFPGCEPKQQPRDLVPLISPTEFARKVKPLQDRIKQLDEEIKNLTPTSPAGAAQPPGPTEKSIALRKAQSERTELVRETTLPVAYAVAEGEPKDACVQKKGEPNDPGELVPRKFLSALGDQKVQSRGASGRMELANWIASPTNPLTARVFVNRVWLWHFGRGLVKTPNDFGTRGTAPTHPELLDYLTSEFVLSGWDVKALNRLIMLSATYQASSAPVKVIKREPSHGKTPPVFRGEIADLYASFPRRRLTAEELRDSLLAISGDLDHTPGEAHPFPPEAGWSFTQHEPFAAEYDTLKRSVYRMQKRNRRDRFSMLFDGADPNASTPLRDMTTVPTQALFFMNDPFVQARAEKLAARIQGAGTAFPQQILFAYRETLGRAPSAVETVEAETFLRDYEASLSDTPLERRPALAWTAYARVLFSSNEFLYLD